MTTCSRWHTLLSPSHLLALALLAAACSDNPLAPAKPADPLATAANDPAVLPGAPSNGVRFILYALDLGGQPIATQPIGYADLMDESSGNAQTLHILVVGTTTDPAVTYLDYTVSAIVGATSASGAVVGFISDGTER